MGPERVGAGARGARPRDSKARLAPLAWRALWVQHVSRCPHGQPRAALRAASADRRPLGRTRAGCKVLRAQRSPPHPPAGALDVLLGRQRPPAPGRRGWPVSQGTLTHLIRYPHPPLTHLCLRRQLGGGRRAPGYPRVTRGRGP